MQLQERLFYFLPYFLLYTKIFVVVDTKAQQYLQGIQSSDEGQQLQAVIEMCQVNVVSSITAIWN